jgi:hypothetical protein
MRYLILSLLLASSVANASEVWTLIDDEPLQNDKHLCTYQNMRGEVMQLAGWYCAYTVYR